MKVFLYGLFIAICLMLFGCNSAYHMKSRTMMLVSAEGSCSGTQVKAPSGKSYILSAAHCKPLMFNGKIMVIDESGHLFVSKVLDMDSDKDLLLMEGMPHMSGLPIAKAAHTGERVTSYTHGHGLPTYEASGKLLGSVHTIQIPNEIESEKEMHLCKHIMPTMFGLMCLQDRKTWATSMKVMPGSSGGGVLNASGELVGVVSAGNMATYQGELVPLNQIRQFLRSR